MYLSAQKCFKLDNIVKSFEVGIRTHISTVVYKSYNSKDRFEEELRNINSALTNTTIVNAGYIKSITSNMLKNCNEIYDAVEYSHNCRVKKDYDFNNVLYTSQIFELAIIFFNPLFINLGKNFETNNEFLDLSIRYSRIRNALSHPASSKIKIDDSKIIVKYIEKIMEKLEHSCFWYITKSEIHSLLSEYKRLVDSTAFSMHNLEQMTIDYKRLISRENEIAALNDLILGKDESYRKAGSVVLYGYGGVGKTALVTEFIYRLVKRKLDDEKINLSFLLYFTSKEEKLDVSKTTGDLYISSQRRTISTYEELEKAIFYYLNISSFEEYKKITDPGLIVVDNIETFSESDKDKILTEFVKISPRNIQFLITSRNEEKCEESIHIEGFRSEEEGLNFIDEYIQDNELEIEIEIEHKRELIRSSNGNTLILILSLTRLNISKTSIDQIIYELDNVSTQNTEIISSFMYKNTFDNVIRELEYRKYNPIEVLQIISYYGEPIDLLTINLLCKEKNIKNVEFVCKELSKRLILNKNTEFYELNEFASKFVFIKLKPNTIDLLKLTQDIKERKSTIQSSLERLNTMKSKHDYLEELINEWMPRTYIDKLAVAEVYNLYSDALRIVKSKGIDIEKALSEFNDKFTSYELSTPHPYIRYQKARCYQVFLKEDIDVDTNKEIVNSCFEESIFGIEYDYTFIQKTKSYGFILWLFGQFKMKYYNDYHSALRYFQEAKLNFELVNLIDETYFKVVSNMCDSLYFITKDTTDSAYTKLYAETLYLLHQNKHKYDTIKRHLNYHDKLVNS